MKELARLLREHFEAHPDMEVQDAVKFLYQSHMGGGHLVRDEAASLARLEEEWARVEGRPDAPPGSPLGHGRARLHLNACKGNRLSPSTVNRLFLLSAQETVPDPQGLEQDLELVRSLPFPQKQADEYLARYRAQGCPMVGHSQAYRSAYHPAYRVVSSYFVAIFPVLAAIDRLVGERSPVRVAIDGPCASGKSTLGEALARIYRCPLVHMDDFFLRPEQRTPERLAQPGGNVDYQRFSQEVLSPLCQGREVRFRPWRCRTGEFGPEITLPPSPLTVVEGSYSLRPDLRDSYDLRIWVEAPWPLRKQRLALRGGPGCLERFETFWIPMEDRYFQACQVKECCHLVLQSR